MRMHTEIAVPATISIIMEMAGGRSFCLCFRKSSPHMGSWTMNRNVSTVDYNISRFFIQMRTQDRVTSVESACQNMTAVDDGYRRLCPPTLIRRGAARRGPAREHPGGPFGNERGRRRPRKSGAGRVSPSREAAPAQAPARLWAPGALAQHWKCPQIVPLVDGDLPRPLVYYRLIPISGWRVIECYLMSPCIVMTLRGPCAGSALKCSKGRRTPFVGVTAGPSRCLRAKRASPAVPRTTDTGTALWVANQRRRLGTRPLRHARTHPRLVSTALSVANQLPVPVQLPVPRRATWVPVPMPGFNVAASVSPPPCTRLWCCVCLLSTSQHSTKICA